MAMAPAWAGAVMTLAPPKSASATSLVLVMVEPAGITPIQT